MLGGYRHPMDADADRRDALRAVIIIVRWSEWRLCGLGFAAGLPRSCSPMRSRRPPIAAMTLADVYALRGLPVGLAYGRPAVGSAAFIAQASEPVPCST